MILLKFHPKQSAFTLVELLTVIAITAILATILIPIIGSVRMKAEISHCSNNLRQMGNAINLYANDHDGRYPGPSWVTITHDLTYRNSSWEYHPLSHFIAPYLELEITSDQVGENFVLETAICPYFEDNYGPSSGEIANEGHYKRNPDPVLSPFGGRQDDGSYGDPITIFNAEEQIGKSHAKIISIYTNDISNGYGPGEPIYDGKRNYLFLDGHVELIEGIELPE